MSVVTQLLRVTDSQVCKECESGGPRILQYTKTWGSRFEVIITNYYKTTISKDTNTLIFPNTQRPLQNYL